MAKDISEKYIKTALKKGATEAKLIHPSSVVTAPWVRMKCQFGCPAYGKSYCCPPDTPNHQQTREMMDSYQNAILFRIEEADTANRSKNLKKVYKSLVDLEGQLFRDGFYKAFFYTSGPCSLCKECEKMNSEPCKLGYKARPSMEACGIDVFQTAKNAGLFIETLSKMTETQNRYCLLMFD